MIGSDQMKPLIRVFVCSTYADLVDERRATLDSIGQLKLQHESMEFFGARSGRPLDTCLEEVRKSNVIVVIVGHRYGSLVPGDSISFSEAEYKEAQRLKKSCLVYMRDDNAEVPATSFETDPAKLQRLLDFKRALNDRHTVARFLGSEDLAQRVRADLLDNIELVEAEERRRQESSRSDAAFLDELKNMALRAVEEGLRETLILSAFRTALGDLRGRPPRLLDRLRSAFVEISRFTFGRSDQDWPWVFLSYAHADQHVVQQVAVGLRKLKIRAWVDQQELLAGDSLVNEIERGLNAANALVFFASHASLKSRWAMHELDYFARPTAFEIPEHPPSYQCCWKTWIFQDFYVMFST